MDDSLNVEHLENLASDGNGPFRESSVATRMDDSLDLGHVNGNGAPNLEEFYLKSETTTGRPAGNIANEMAMQKTHMEAVMANEIFSDPQGMDFLANAGSKSGVQDSELARQSLFQNFDPFVGKAPLPIVSQQPRATAPQLPTVMGSPGPLAGGGGTFKLPFRQAYPTQSHTATTDMIAAMQQKQNAILRSQAATTDRLLQPTQVTVTEQQPASWPDRVTRRDVNPPPFATMKQLPPLPHAVATTPTSSHQSSQQPHTPSSQAFNSPSADFFSTNGSGDSRHMTNGGTSNGGNLEEDYESSTLRQQGGPPGSLVNLGGSGDATPRRPVTLRTKQNNSLNADKQLYRRSVPAGFLDGHEGTFGAMSLSPMESREEFSGYPELNPMWENVLATYEGLLRVTLNKLSVLQAESCAAKQNEAKAVKDQEEMHRVFVGLHERFECSKTVIATYKTNQETLQRSFDDLNAEFQPVLLENKKMQAAVRLNDMRMRQLEGDLVKKKDEIAELTKIVDDLISKDS